jgi:predicted phosphodiesterase
LWDSVLEKFGLDPAKFMVTGSVRHSAWDVPGHGVQKSYRANIVERPEFSADIEDLLDHLYLGDVPQRYSAQVWRTLQIGDTHIGKGEAAGGGTENIIQRWKRGVKNALEGEDTNVHIAFLGDLVEGYVSQSGANIAECDLTLAEQLRVTRHLVMWTIQYALTECMGKVIVSAVPGNHGEATRMQNRPHTDSHDIDIVSAVQQAFEMSGHKHRIQWFYPEPDKHHVTYKVGDTTFTAAHGHLFKGQMSGAEKWWSGMTVNGQPPGAANILMSGHFHNMQVANFTSDKWIMFSPSLETKSVWFHEKTGNTSTPGILAYDTIGGRPVNITVF